MSFPFFVLVIAIISVLGPGLASFFIAVALVAWVSYARLVRSQVLVLKHADFVLAARSLGYGHLRVMFRHILPNAVMPAIVAANVIEVPNAEAPSASVERNCQSTSQDRAATPPTVTMVLTTTRDMRRLYPLIRVGKRRAPARHRFRSASFRSPRA